MMPVSTLKDRTYTDKGRDLLERNLCGRCKSTLKAANTVAHKLDPLLTTSVPGSASDLELVGEYFHEFNQKLFYVKEARQAYFNKFAGDLDLLADFNNWFDPRFSVLQDVEKYTRDWIDKNTVEIHICHSQMSQSLDYEESLHLEDSASQIASHNQDNVSHASSRRTSHASTSSSRTSITYHGYAMRKILPLCRKTVTCKSKGFLCLFGHISRIHCFGLKNLNLFPKILPSE